MPMHPRSILSGRLFAALALALLSVPAIAAAAPVTFEVNAPGAASVYLAGDFNAWNPTGRLMTDDDGDGVFTATVELAPGRYAYKFVIDGTWKEDPSAAEFVDDGFGGKNSVVVVGTSAATPAAPRATEVKAPATEGVRFAVEAKGAKSVFIAGEFNGWNPTANAMSDTDGDGTFEIVLPLDPGRYAYKFVVDGNWKHDETAADFVDDGFGGKNSVIEVGAGTAAPATTSAAPKPRAATDAPAVAAGERLVRFVAAAPGAREVFVAGEFNGWDPQATRMTDADQDGSFEAVLPLTVGQRFAYKFVIDGNWKHDESAGDFVDDGFGGKNSVVEILPGTGVQDAGAAGTSTAPTQTGAATGGATGGAAEGLRSVKFSYQPVISGVNEVMLAGSFNDWNVGATPMTDPDGNGIYEANLLLAPGNYQYKFVVDGAWITDDQADDFADDGFGGRNSIIFVDARYEGIDVEVGDGEFYLEGLDTLVDYGTVNEVEPGEAVFRTRAYLDDVEKVELLIQEPGADLRRVPMELAVKDPVFATYEARVLLEKPEDGCRFTFVYHDGGKQRYALGVGGFAEEEPKSTLWPLYSHDVLPPFRIPAWAQRGVYYQIFPDRFRNGSEENDPDFTESYYDTKRTLPASGKLNGEYFHFVDDWNDLSGLKLSPHRTDGKPDYFSFYGGDIVGVHEQLDHLASIGVTMIYFNPITDARSNHRYDPCDYSALDPHLATEDEFRAFTADALGRGIRVIVDMAYNHTGDCHFAFQDAVQNGPQSEYWNWYEFKKPLPQWPLPASAQAIDYYDCWWGFGLHPNLNFDLSRPNAQEMTAPAIEQAEVNWPVVNHLLDSVDYWMGDLGVSGFRLDVPNEVPFWFWGLFRERCRDVRPEHVLIGEIWGDAGSWIHPDVFDAVMNYKYFKDPVVKWIGQKQGNAATFDRELAPGRTRYPLQAVRAQMNLIDSHDTARFLHIAGGDPRRLQLAATFAMTYVGSPHIYYGNEVALTGDRDPDCRRTFPWDQIDVPARKATLEHYQKVGGLRHEYDALVLGDFRTVHAQGDVYSYLRQYGDQRVLVVLNNGATDADVTLPVGNVGVSDGTGVQQVLGAATTTRVERGAMKVAVPAVGAAIFVLEASNTGR